ncbi:hypothetical protein DZC78_09170 [Olleya aquimaris]|uniref:Outer membrane protein beta-barrel domain-containing protein n=1 Tax=Olleya sediminilitoris TaxID=2795739 RepID=A0ABS1WGN5_9FLAO|nr:MULTISPECIES: DUF6646 family protein [Olleya]AXO80546.1 hypothetical protein DZC78_09170 [Olleya aquimaris]MBL7558274.1 hypothetical protein [Olleya sediminilitoris]
MKKGLLLVALILTAGLVNAQAFDGKGDQKLSIGANLQNNVNGITLAYDYGLGENISVGVVTGYALNLNNGLDADFTDRFELEGRFNANLGNVVNVSDNFDFYPGISLSLKNFGGHFGMRYFFSDGFGIFSEFGTTFAKFNSDALTPAEKIHNQFTVNIGAVFNL